MTLHSMAPFDPNPFVERHAAFDLVAAYLRYRFGIAVPVGVSILTGSHVGAFSARCFRIVDLQKMADRWIDELAEIVPGVSRLCATLSMQGGEVNIAIGERWL